MRPDSMKKFDMLFLGALAVGVANFALSYGRFSALMEQQMAQAGVEGMGSTALLIGALIGFGLMLGLWLLVSRLRIEFIKWILLLLVVYNAAMLPQSVAQSLAGESGISALLGVVALALQVAALWFLFRPASKAWLSSKGE
jgi:hypothetical protein